MDGQLRETIERADPRFVTVAAGCSHDIGRNFLFQTQNF